MDHDRARQETSPLAARPAERILAVVLLVALCALHFDWWRTKGPGASIGWLPQEFAWRLAWIVLAFLYLWWFTARFWPAPRARGAQEERPG